MRNLAFAFALVAVVPMSASAAELVAVARIPSDARDSRNETLGGMGSGMALVPGSWIKGGGEYHARLAMNDNAQLGRFGLHNGAPNDSHNLYEKWESMALAPARDPKAPNDFFLFIGSDNDFITQHGMMAGKPYADKSGANVDSLILVYRVTLGR